MNSLWSLSEVARDETGVPPKEPETDLFNLEYGGPARAGPAPMRLWDGWGGGQGRPPGSLGL